MSTGSYKQRLTALGCWGIVQAIVMPFAALFFFAIYHCYAVDAAAYADQGLTQLADQSARLASIFAMAAFGPVVCAILGLLMVWKGREVYFVEPEPEIRRVNGGLRDLCAIN